MAWLILLGQNCVLHKRLVPGPITRVIDLTSLPIKGRAEQDLKIYVETFDQHYQSPNIKL